MMNIKSNSCKLFLILSIFLATNTIKADGPRIVITYPLSGMHTRAESVLIEGKIDGFKPSQVLISLDQSTILTQKVNCTDGNFQLEVKLGAGKTNVSASAKPDGMQLVETGFYIFRDCTVTNIIGLAVSKPCTLNRTGALPAAASPHFISTANWRHTPSMAVNPVTGASTAHVFSGGLPGLRLTLRRIHSMLL